MRVTVYACAMLRFAQHHRLLWCMLQEESCSYGVCRGRVTPHMTYLCGRKQTKTPHTTIDQGLESTHACQSVRPLSPIVGTRSCYLVLSQGQRPVRDQSIFLQLIAFYRVHFSLTKLPEFVLSVIIRFADQA